MIEYERKEQFKNLVEEIKDFPPAIFAIIYKANIEWTEDISTACVALHNGHVCFYFNPSFWDSLTLTERLFVILHEIYHVFLYHFTRFGSFTQLENIALDVAVNHTLLRHFTFKRKEDLPYLDKILCWNDTVLKDMVLLDTLSAEEYIMILKTHSKKMNSNMNSIDNHEKSTGISGKGIDDLIDQIGDTLKDQFPEMSQEEQKDIKEDIKEALKSGDLDKLIGKEAGTGRTSPQELKEYFEKREQPWRRFARYFTKQVLETIQQDHWLPNKRVHHLLKEGMFVPGQHDIEVEHKVPVLILLDTSGSCEEYKKHFIGFAKALPQDLFDIKCYGFHDSYYQLDINKPKYQSGGTSFSFFQKLYDSVQSKHGKKYAFVFTDGRGTRCNLSHPDNWHWFLFERGSSKAYIPKDCKIHKLEDFT